jgi:hypothetical protein
MIRLVEINTTAFEEENFLLLTDLTDEQIENAILPIVRKEREEEIEYINDDLVVELERLYPHNTITHILKDDVEYISI